MKWADYSRQHGDEVEPCDCDAGFGPHKRVCASQVSSNRVFKAWVSKHRDSTAKVFSGHQRGHYKEFWDKNKEQFPEKYAEYKSNGGV